MTGKELVKLLRRNGWELGRIAGSHTIMTKPGRRSISLPVHGSKDLPRGTVAAVLKQAGIES